MFDKKVLDILINAGWYEDRKIDISEQVKKLELYGFEVFDTAIRFLEEYDQLNLEHTEPFYIKFNNTKSAYDIFNVAEALISANTIPNSFQERAIPIGGLSDWEMILFITETGKIVTDISVIGDTIEEGIENIIKNTNGYPLKSYFINPKYVPASFGGFSIEYDGTFVEYKGNDIQIVIPNNIMNIGDASFWGCHNIESVIISDNVSEIGATSFCQCTSLKSIDIPNSVHNISYSAFYGCRNLTTVHLPKALSEISMTSFSRCINLTSIMIPDRVQKIMNGAFLGCKNLQEIVIPENVEMIGRNAFDSCTALKNVEFHNGLKKIFPLAFYNCKGLENIVLPDSITSVGECAFEQCDNLKTVSIPETLTNIGKDAFGNAKVIVRKKV